VTLFEYLAVANSIVISFAVIRLLDAFPPAFDPARRYWTHCAFLVVAIWACAQYWWVSWSFASVASWTYAKFILYLVPPALLYSVARALSSADPNEVDSFLDHYQLVRRRLFTLLTAYMFFLLIGSWIIGGIPLIHPLRVVQLVGLVASLSGALVGSPRYHAVLAGGFLLGLALLTLRILSEPAPLTASP
jgi:hypothetical protein